MHMKSDDVTVLLQRPATLTNRLEAQDKYTPRIPRCSIVVSHSLGAMSSFTQQRQAQPVESEATHTLRRMRGKSSTRVLRDKDVSRDAL